MSKVTRDPTGQAMADAFFRLLAQIDRAGLVLKFERVVSHIPSVKIIDETRDETLEFDFTAYGSGSEWLEAMQECLSDPRLKRVVEIQESE